MCDLQAEQGSYLIMSDHAFEDRCIFSTFAMFLKFTLFTNVVAGVRFTKHMPHTVNIP